MSTLSCINGCQVGTCVKGPEFTIYHPTRDEEMDVCRRHATNIVRDLDGEVIDLA